MDKNRNLNPILIVLGLFVLRVLLEALPANPEAGKSYSTGSIREVVEPLAYQALQKAKELSDKYLSDLLTTKKGGH